MIYWMRRCFTKNTSSCDAVKYSLYTEADSQDVIITTEAPEAEMIHFIENSVL